MAAREITPSPGEAIVQLKPNLIELALKNGANMDTIERLVALQERMTARDAEVDFNMALNRAQSALGPVSADLTNPQTKSKYASYAAIDRKVRPIYAKEGLALSFDTDESPLPEHVRVLCYVSHAGGHTRTYHADMPADGKGAKGGDVMTKTHAAGSAMSYGMRYLVKMIFNVAVGEDDNDGNGAPTTNISEHLEWIANAKDLDELQRIFTNAYRIAYKAGDKTAMDRLVKAKDSKKKEL